MALPVEVNPIFEGNRYAIQRSLRFRASATAYLYRTPSSTSNQQTWTWSAWIKRGSLGSFQRLFGAVDGAFNDETNGLRFNSSDQLNFLWITSGSNTVSAQITTTQVFRDVSSWYHVVMVANTTSATTTITGASTDRLRLYINGVQVSAFGTATVPAQNANGYVNQNVLHRIAAEAHGASPTQTFDGYLSEVNFIDGLQLDPTYFGQYNEFGVWSPRKYGGSYGTNGFYLPFNDPTSATTLCYDRQLGYTDNSKNNWTPNNISVAAGTTYDAMTDVPPPSTIQNVAAGNYCVLNPLNSNATTLNNANLSFIGDTGATYAKGCLGTIGVSSGKWYFESTITTVGASFVGVAPSTGSGLGNVDIEGILNAYSYFSTNGNKYLGTGGGITSSAYGNTFTTNDIIGVALDLDNGAIYFSKNNTWQNSGDPTSGASRTGAAFTGITGSYTPAPCGYNGSAQSLNFGQRPFAYAPPSGYRPLNSNNLPAPTIPNGAKVMAATLYTGTGSTNPIYNSANNTLGVTFKPDFVWIRNRPDASGGMWLDSVRGTSVFLQTTNANGDATNTGDFVSFNNDGFTVGGNGNLANLSTKGFVGWNWNAGSGSSTVPSGGTITPTGASINVSAGFSVITYTAPVGTSTDTIPHGLGVAPSFIIVKCRVTSAVYNSWGVYHSSLGATKYLELNTTGAAGTASTWWNNTAPTASVFSVGSQFLEDNSTYVAYCWTPIAGYSSMGSYTGNGSADGPFIFTNMRPRWLMIKRTDVAGENWYLYDTSRDTYNVMQNTIQPNLVNAESGSSARYFDLLSNGFKVRNSDTAFNGSGSTYIYVAFAENPFKLALAR